MRIADVAPFDVTDLCYLLDSVGTRSEGLVLYCIRLNNIIKKKGGSSRDRQNLFPYLKKLRAWFQFDGDGIVD